jgi:hypothetical protein
MLKGKGALRDNYCDGLVDSFNMIIRENDYDYSESELTSCNVPFHWRSAVIQFSLILTIY